jgi:ribosomal RNA assembly protein
MDEEYRTMVKVPKDRIAVVIGKKGATKNGIEQATGCKLSVNPEDNMVGVSGDDPLKIYTVQQIVKAIARGFNPSKAMILLKGDYMMEIIELRLLVKKEHMQRVKGRIIGGEWKCRDVIQNLTDTMISVFGKTVSILGRPESVELAKRAIMNLILGSPHANVYKWLEKKHVELSAQELMAKDFIKEEYKDD